jgi:hypothetical protein
MIVLDEQLLGYGLNNTIAKWYRGKVTDITALRPGTLIHDDAIPALLRAVRESTFITINVTDFWRRLAPDPHFCMICFPLPHSRAREISGLLRRLFALEPFRTRRQRLGKIARVSHREVQFYTTESWAIQRLDWPK